MQRGIDEKILQSKRELEFRREVCAHPTHPLCHTIANVSIENFHTLENGYSKNTFKGKLWGGLSIKELHPSLNTQETSVSLKHFNEFTRFELAGIYQLVVNISSCYAYFEKLNVLHGCAF